MNPGIFWVYSVVKHSDDDIHLETQLLSQEENQDCRPTPDNWFMEVSPGFPPIAFLPAGKPFKGFSKTQELSALITAFPLSIFFFFQLTEVFKLLELKIHNLISQPIPSFSGRSLFPDTQSYPASYMPAQLLSDLSLAEVFCLIQLYVPETLPWFLLLSGENLFSWIISLYFAFLLPTSTSFIQNRVVTYSSV